MVTDTFHLGSMSAVLRATLKERVTLFVLARNGTQVLSESKGECRRRLSSGGIVTCYGDGSAHVWNMVAISSVVNRDLLRDGSV